MKLKYKDWMASYTENKPIMINSIVILVMIAYYRIQLPADKNSVAEYQISK